MDENQENKSNKTPLPIIKFTGLKEIQEFSGIAHKLIDLAHKNYLNKVGRQDTFDEQLEAYLASLSSTHEKLLCLKRHELDCEAHIAKAISSRMKGDQKFFTEILNEKILPKINLYQKQLELEKLEADSTQAAKSKPQVTSTRINPNKSAFVWKVNPKVSTAIMDLLISKGCFDPKDRIKILKTFYHEAPTDQEPILVYGLMKRLPTIFFDLIEAGIVEGQKKEIAGWITQKFISQDKETGKVRNFTFSTVHGALNEGKPGKRLALSHPEYVDLTAFSQVL